MNSKFISFILLLANSFVFSQQIQLTPVLIGSAGIFSQGAWGSISSSAGEAMIFTASSNNYIFTQGFHQPNILQNLEIQAITGNVSCNNAKDGWAAIKVFGGLPPYTYIWTPNLSARDSASGIGQGNYSVTVRDSWGKEDFITFSIETDKKSACYFRIYNGITPNGDGQNDKWEIDGIESFRNNSVFIYNRWGDKVWEGNDYNNTNVIWEGMNKNGEPLPAGTYYYIVTLNDQIHKGWVELSK